jgi:hypothetical protein
MAIKMKKSDLVIAFTIIAALLAGVMAGLVGCQNGLTDGLDLGTESVTVDGGGIWGGGGTPPSTVPATGLVLKDAAGGSTDTLSGAAITMNVGETKTVYADVRPANATDGAVQWTSSHTASVTTGTPHLQAAGIWLNQEVTLTAGSTLGTATISAHVDGVTPDKTFTVIVQTPATVPVSSVTVTPNTLTLEVGKSATLTADVQPANATNPTVTWTSADDDIATVDPATGEVTGVTETLGDVVITATADGQSDTCTVTVIKASTSAPPPVPPGGSGIGGSGGNGTHAPVISIGGGGYLGTTLTWQLGRGSSKTDTIEASIMGETGGFDYLDWDFDPPNGTDTQGVITLNNRPGTTGPWQQGSATMSITANGKVEEVKIKVQNCDVNGNPATGAHSVEDTFTMTVTKP